MEKEFIIELTNACSNACLHCSSECKSITKGQFYFEVKYLKSLTKVLKNNGFNTIVYSGGEPFKYDGFVDITSFFKKNGFSVKVYTSGNFENGYCRNICSSIDTVVFSIHSWNEEKHNFISNNDEAYDKLLSNFYFFKKNYVDVEINIVPMSLNINDIATTYLTFKRYISKFNVLKLVKQGNAKSNWNVLRYDPKVLNNELSKLTKYKTVQIGNSFKEVSNCNHHCDAGIGKICLTCDGYLIPCEVFKDKRYFFPNIYNDGLSSVIKRYGELRKIQRTSRGCLSQQILIELKSDYCPENFMFQMHL